MKSIYTLVILATLFLLLSACNSDDSDSKATGNDESAPQTEQNNNQDTSENKDENSGKTDQNKKSNSDKSDVNSNKQSDENGTANKDGNDGNMSQKQVLQAVKNELDTELDKQLPTSLPLKKGKHLSAATKSNANSYRVIFFASDNPIPIDNKALNDKNQATEIARLQVKKWGSEQEANKQIGYEDYGENGGQKVDLGHGIKGYQDAGAGSVWTSWNEGRWALATHAQTTKPEAGKKLAKRTVNDLETHSLPVPKQNGMVRLDAAGTSNQIMWQKKDVVYTLDHVDDPIEALDIATTFK